MRPIALSFLALVLVGCNATYRAPAAQAQPASVGVAAPKDRIVSAAVQEIAAQGLQLAAVDRESGVVSTAPKQMRLDETQADLGSTMGLAYIKDSRTVTRVSYTILAAEQSLSVSATIQGEYLPGDSVNGKTMEGVSTGVLERDLAAKIKARAER